MADRISLTALSEAEKKLAEAVHRMRFLNEKLTPLSGDFDVVADALHAVANAMLVLENQLMKKDIL